MTAPRKPGKCRAFVWCARVPTDYLACIAAMVALHPAPAGIFVCIPRCLTRPVVKRLPGSLSRVAFEINCRKAPVLFITWRSNKRAGLKFLGCRVFSPRPPNAADGATAGPTPRVSHRRRCSLPLIISECPSLDAFRNDKVAHCFWRRTNGNGSTYKAFLSLEAARSRSDHVVVGHCRRRSGRCCAYGPQPHRAFCGR
jgi:hypothetical protein